MPLMTSRVPPGWPAELPPATAPEFTERVTTWLFDACPPDYRGHAVLRRHPAALAWLAAQHVDAQARTTIEALGTVRAELGDPAMPGHLAPRALEQLVEALHAEQARLLSLARATALVAEALQGTHHVPRR